MVIEQRLPSKGYRACRGTHPRISNTLIYLWTQKKLDSMNRAFYNDLEDYSPTTSNLKVGLTPL